MAAMWLAGFEDQPGRAGEILVVEVFGDDVEPGRSVSVGVGHKQLGDPNLVHDFEKVPLSLDVAEMHTYAVDWDQQVSVFTVDGEVIKRASRPPTYPMQVMVAVYDFPDRGPSDDSDPVPEMIIAHIGG
jgi:beta-glucanase (GH16 family)